MLGLTLKKSEKSYPINDRSKYVLLRKGGFGWGVISETGEGVYYEDVKQIHEYHIRFKKEDPRDLLIVEVGE